MTVPSESSADIKVREELDVVSVDPMFVERQRNRYASRGVAFIVLLNGAAAVALLVALSQGISNGDKVKPFADAMVVFGVGAALGLLSAFFAYASRTLRLERQGFTTWRRPLRWLAIAAAIAGTVCFVGGLNMARVSLLPEESTKGAETKPAQPERTAPQPNQPEQIQPQ